MTTIASYIDNFLGSENLPDNHGLVLENEAWTTSLVIKKDLVSRGEVEDDLDDETMLIVIGGLLLKLTEDLAIAEAKQILEVFRSHGARFSCVDNSLYGFTVRFTTPSMTGRFRLGPSVVMVQ